MIIDGVPIKQIRKLVESYAKAEDRPIPMDVLVFLKATDSSWKPIVINVDPINEPCEIEGIVRDINGVNFFRRLNIEDNPINRLILGKLVAEPYSELIVREKVEGNSRTIQQWHIFIPSQEITSGLRTGMRIVARIEAKYIDIEEGYPIWIAVEIYWD